MIIFWLFVFLVLITVITIAVSTVVMIWVRVPFVSTPWPVVEKMLEVAEIKPREKVYELGCGRGRMMIMADKRYGAKAEGFEISLFPYVIARLNIWLRRSKAKARFKNFLKVDLHDADVILCYLSIIGNKKLGQKLDRELKPGARVISNGFVMKEWKKLKIEEKRTECRGRRIYCYKVL